MIAFNSRDGPSVSVGLHNSRGAVPIFWANLNSNSCCSGASGIRPVVNHAVKRKDLEKLSGKVVRDASAVTV
jgi:hypothetical protein